MRDGVVRAGADGQAWGVGNNIGVLRRGQEFSGEWRLRSGGRRRARYRRYKRRLGDLSDKLAVKAANASPVARAGESEISNVEYRVLNIEGLVVAY
jgi:hypothetical protein